MKFVVEKEIFEKIPDLCFGVVMAEGITNNINCAEIHNILSEAINNTALRLDGTKVKESSEIIPYREAFRSLGINPNKYMCSIEALFTRIAKGKGMPFINPVVDLGNAISLKYTLPIGAHDLKNAHSDICVRFSCPGDTFLPFGESIEETPEEKEVLYAVGNQIRTRRWTWRQSEHGKIEADSSVVFFPIDGFADFNKEKVMAARDELASLLERFFSCDLKTGFVDAEHPDMELF